MNESNFIHTGPEKVHINSKIPGFVKVGVFTEERPGRTTRISAYTRDYSSEWKGCCEHLVPEEQRKDAKKIAIAEHKARCMPDGK